MKTFTTFIESLSLLQVGIVLGLVAGLLFGQGLANEMVLDDWKQVAENRLIHSLEHMPKLLIGSTFYSGKNIRLEGLYYRPLMLSSFALIYHWFGDNPIPYRLLQLGLHIANSLLIYVILKRHVRKILAIVTGLVFLVHPVVVETVVYISNLQDVLFTFLGLVSSMLLMQQIEQKKIRLGWSLVFLFLALMAKEVAVVFWVANVVYLWAITRREWMRYLVFGGVLVAVYGILRVLAVGWPDADRVIPIADTTVWERLQTWPRIQAYYARMLLFPKDMAIAQNWVVRQISIPDFWIPLGVAIAYLGTLLTLSWLAWNKAVRHRAIVAYAVALVATGVGIHSQLFPLDVTVTDRWFYTTLLGILMLVAILVEVWIKKISAPLLLGIGVLLLVMFARSFVRVGDWNTGYSLYSHDYPLVEDSFTLENNLGLEYLKQGKIDLAQHHLERSVMLSPEWGISWNNLGLVYETLYQQTGDNNYLILAENAYVRAIDYPSGVSPFVNLSRVLLVSTNRTEAEKLVFVENALGLFPEEPDLWFVKSRLLLETGFKQESLQAAKRLVELQPNRQSQWWLQQVLSDSVGADNN